MPSLIENERPTRRRRTVSYPATQVLSTYKDNGPEIANFKPKNNGGKKAVFGKYLFKFILIR